MLNRLRHVRQASLSAFVLLVACSAEDPRSSPPPLSSEGSSSGGSLGGGSSSGGQAPNAGPLNTGGIATAAGGAVTSSGGSTQNASGGSGGGGVELAPLTGITAAHNVVRAEALPVPSPALVPLVWEPSLAAVAQTWAEGCMFKHSQGAYGENIYARAGAGQGSAQNVVDSWASEIAEYSYADNSCALNATCGHYTQIVWGNSRKLGCGVQQCSQNSPFQGFPDWEFWVCNYDPPGNLNGQKPY